MPFPYPYTFLTFLLLCVSFPQWFFPGMLGVPSTAEIYKEPAVAEKTLAMTTTIPGESPTWQERKPQGEELIKVKHKRIRTRTPGNQSSFHLLCQNPQVGMGREGINGPVQENSPPITCTSQKPCYTDPCPTLAGRRNLLTLGVKEFRKVPSLGCQNPGVHSSSGGAV